MDSNVSKSTFLHTFLKLRFTNINYSIKNLLKENLLPAIDLYTQRQNLCINRDNLNKAIAQKINLIHHQSTPSSSQIGSHQLLLSSQSKKYIYRCAIAFPLANYCQLRPENVSRELVNCLYFLTKPGSIIPNLEFNISLSNSGLIDFYLLSNSLKTWLEHPLILSKEKLKQSFVKNLNRIDRNLFSLQYAHSLCCSWLRLGEQEGLIKLRDDELRSLSTVSNLDNQNNLNLSQANWYIAKPEKIIWCDGEDNLWLSHESEYRLLWQLLNVVDSWFENSGKWQKLAFNLSEAFFDFEAQCRFFGEVKQQTPDLAIARLGLIALVQFWLKKLLEEKLNIVALTEV